MPPFVHKVPATPKFLGEAILRGFNVTSAALKAAGLGNHNAYVDAEFRRDHVADQQALDLNALGFSTVTTAEQARLTANALRSLIPAHLADGIYAHLAADSTSAAITAPLADGSGIGNVTTIGSGNAGVNYTPSQAGVSVEHSGGVTQSLTIGVIDKAIKVNLAGAGSSTTKGTGNAGLTFVANQSGVTVENFDPGADTASEIVTVTLKAIKVTLRYATGAVTSTGEQVRTAIANSTAAMAKLTSVANAGDGSGTVVPAAASALTWAQTSTADQVRAAVALSTAAMALLSSVANTGNGSGTVAVQGATSLSGSGAARTLLNQEKATLNTHFARAPEHNTLPGTPLAIGSADATDDASAVTLANEMLQEYLAHTMSVALTIIADPASP